MRQATKNKKSILATYVISGFIVLLAATSLNIPIASSAPVECLESSCPKVSLSAPTGDRSTSEPIKSAAKTPGKLYCGGGKEAVEISFNIGCVGKGNPITDAAFAIIRFLSLGVGLIIVGSLTYAGIQYTAARGDPKASGDAKNRINSNVIAFFIYILSFAILNFLIPKGFFGQ